MLSAPVPLQDLETAGAIYAEEIGRLVEEDADTAAYVRHLEEQHDAEVAAGNGAQDLVSEVERFLREQ